MNFLKSLFQGKRLNKPINLSSLGTDMHSHLLPGIDDGSPDIETTIFLLEELASLGFKKVITTPHVMYDLYRNNPDTIKKKEEEVIKAITQNNISIEFEAAAEYLLDEGFSKLVSEGNMLTFGDNYLLVELPYSTEPNNLGYTLFDLQAKGYKVIIAHPERYDFWHNKPDVYHNLKDAGIFFQLNINSVTSFHSASVRKTATWLVKSGMIDFLGSDLHNKAYLSIMKKALENPLIKNLVESGKLKNQEL